MTLVPREPLLGAVKVVQDISQGETGSEVASIRQWKLFSLAAGSGPATREVCKGQT